MQEDTKLLGISYLFSLLEVVMPSVLWFIPPLFAYGFIVENMDALYNCTRIILCVGGSIEVLFIEGVVLYFFHPGFREFLDRNTPSRIQFIKSARKGGYISWLLSFFIGIVFVFLMVNLSNNKPEEQAFNAFIEAHPAYSSAKVINIQEEDFCTLHLLNVDGEHINYLGVWNRFIMVPFLAGYWDKVEYERQNAQSLRYGINLK